MRGGAQNLHLSFTIRVDEGSVKDKWKQMKGINGWKAFLDSDFRDTGEGEGYFLKTLARTAHPRAGSANTTRRTADTATR